MMGFQTNIAGIVGKGREEHKAPVEVLTGRQRGGLSSAVDEVSSLNCSRAHK